VGRAFFSADWNRAIGQSQKRGTFTASKQKALPFLKWQRLFLLAARLARGANHRAIESRHQSGDNAAGRARDDGAFAGSFGDSSLSSNRDSGSAPSNASGGAMSDESRPDAKPGRG